MGCISTTVITVSCSDLQPVPSLGQNQCLAFSQPIFFKQDWFLEIRNNTQSILLQKQPLLTESLRERMVKYWTKTEVSCGFFKSQMVMLPSKVVDLIYRVSNCCYKQDKSPEPLCTLYWSKPNTLLFTLCVFVCLCVLYPEFLTDAVLISEWVMRLLLHLPRPLHKTNTNRGLILYNTIRQNIILYNHLVPGIYCFECVTQELEYGGGNQRQRRQMLVFKGTESILLPPWLFFESEKEAFHSHFS